MRNPLRALGPGWRTTRARHPEAAAGIETGALAIRGYGHLVSEVHALRTRVAELERDHLLLAAHVATLTAAQPTTPDGDEPARQRARLAAIAWYEDRISRLEHAAQRAGHARSARRRTTVGRTSGERPGAGS